MATDESATECLVNDLGFCVDVVWVRSICLCVCVCVCLCVCGRLEREKAMLCRVMYLMIMQAYGVCALIKVLGMIMVLRLV